MSGLLANLSVDLLKIRAILGIRPRTGKRGQGHEGVILSGKRYESVKENLAQEFDILFGPGLGRGQYWRDLWNYRGLLYFLAWRDILVRYKQTVIGIAWSVVNPIFFMVVFSVIFGRLGKFATDGDIPYPLLVLCGLLPWQLFSSGLTQCGKSLVENRHMVSKIYFPRLLVPVSSIMVSLIDFLVALGLLTVVMGFFRQVPDWRIVFLPAFILFAVLVALSLGIWLAAVNVRYRDFQYITPFLVQIGLFVSPVGFSSSNIPDHWRLLYSLNPMVGVIDGFRWCLLGGEAVLYLPGLFTSGLLTVLLLYGAVRHFRRTERTFADII